KSSHGLNPMGVVGTVEDHWNRVSNFYFIHDDRETARHLTRHLTRGGCVSGLQSGSIHSEPEWTGPGGKGRVGPGRVAQLQTRQKVEDDRRVRSTRAREFHAQGDKTRVRARERVFSGGIFCRLLVGGWWTQWCGRRAKLSSVERTTREEREVPKN
ncbi:hypothetical protein PIB30_052780, partial [Stylosanthes scabra]|nr:hypothetical protein [Stylosanthes scabra]